MKNRILSAVLIFSMVTFLFQCKHEVIAPTSSPDPNPIDTNKTDTTHYCDPDTVYFTNTIEKLLNSQCGRSDSSAQGCHDPIKMAEGLILNNYDNVMKGKYDDGQYEKVVIPFSPNSSKLLSVIEKNEMPPYPYTPLTAKEKEDIRKWILQGALNNYCTDCDSVYTFSAFVSPMINGNCIGCHGNSNPGGGIPLTNYTEISSVAGKILQAIKHTQGFKPMPKSASKLSDCEINNFEQWINEGLLDN